MELGWLLKVPWAVVVRTFRVLNRAMRPPILGVDFENRESWRKAARIPNRTSTDIPFESLGGFYRVRVFCDPERDGATNVKGRLVDLERKDGSRDASVDSLDLHWVSASEAVRDLRPGEGEFLDVFYVEFNAAELFGSRRQPFHIYPADGKLRGIVLSHPVAGQVLRVKVSADRAESVLIELKLPEESYFGPEWMRVSHRVYKDGDEPGPWLEVPPAQALGPFEVAGAPIPPGTKGLPSVVTGPDDSNPRAMPTVGMIGTVDYTSSSTAPPMLPNSLVPWPALYSAQAGAIGSAAVPPLQVDPSTWWREQAVRFERLGSSEIDASWHVHGETGDVTWSLSRNNDTSPPDIGSERLSELFMAEARAAGQRLASLSNVPRRFPWAESRDPVDDWLNVVASFPDDGRHSTGSGNGPEGRTVSGGTTKVVTGSKVVCASLASGHRPDTTMPARRVAYKLASLAKSFEAALNGAVEAKFPPEAWAELERAAEEVAANITAWCGPSEGQLFLLAPPHSLQFSAVRPAAQHQWQKSAGRLYYLHDLARRWPDEAAKR